MINLTFDTLKGLEIETPLFVRKQIKDESDGSSTDQTGEKDHSKTEQQEMVSKSQSNGVQLVTLNNGEVKQTNMRTESFHGKKLKI